MRISEPQDDAATSRNATSIKPVELTVLGACFLQLWLLLFIGETILPWHSGAASVWMTVLGTAVCVGGTGLILGGVMANRLKEVALKWVQLAVLGGVALMLPVMIDYEWRVAAPTDAGQWIVRMLLNEVGPILFGVPFFLGTRLAIEQRQGANAQTECLRFALIGCVFVLATYPFVLRPLLSLAQCGMVLSWSFLGFVVLVGWQTWKTVDRSERSSKQPSKTPMAKLWFDVLGSAAIVALLFNVTLRLQRDLVSAPVFWVVALIVFFVCAWLVCSRAQAIPLGLLIPLFAGAIALLVGSLYFGFQWGYQLRNTVALFALAATCLLGFRCLLPNGFESFSMGILYRVTVGGILGAITIVFVAPQVATGYTEYLVTILAVFGVLVGYSLMAGGIQFPNPKWKRMIQIVSVVAFFGLSFALFNFIQVRDAGVKARVRTFHGVTSSVQVGELPKSYMMMFAGEHPRAAEFMAQDLRLISAFWHGPITGVGQMFRAFPQGNLRKVGIIGIGNGGLLAYLDPSDEVTFYEFDAAALLTASQQFAYLPNVMIDIDLEPGDPRLVLSESERRRFDILILDALNVESLPTHLLTKEAFAIWDKHLADDGVLAVNVTNAKFDLMPVVWRQALEQDLEIVPVTNTDNPPNLSAAAEWLLLTRNEEFLRSGNFRTPTAEMTEQARQFQLWTDESINALSVAK